MGGENTGMSTPDGLARVLNGIVSDAATESARAATLGERNHLMFMTFGVLAILLGGLAGPRRCVRLARRLDRSLRVPGRSIRGLTDVPQR